MELMLAESWSRHRVSSKAHYGQVQIVSRQLAIWTSNQVAMMHLSESSAADKADKPRKLHSTNESSTLVSAKKGHLRKERKLIFSESMP